MLKVVKTTTINQKNRRTFAPSFERVAVIFYLLTACLSKDNEQRGSLQLSSVSTLKKGDTHAIKHKILWQQILK